MGSTLTSTWFTLHTTFQCHKYHTFDPSDRKPRQRCHCAKALQHTVECMPSPPSSVVIRIEEGCRCERCSNGHVGLARRGDHMGPFVFHSCANMSASISCTMHTSLLMPVLPQSTASDGMPHGYLGQLFNGPSFMHCFRKSNSIRSTIVYGVI